MKSNPSSSFSDAAFTPLPLTPSGGSVTGDSCRWRQGKRSQGLLSKRKVVWSTAPVQHPVTAEVMRCPTPVFLQVPAHPTATLLNISEHDKSPRPALKSPLSALPTIKRTKTPDVSKFYRFSRFPPYLQHTVERTKTQSPKTQRQFAAKRAETPQYASNLREKRPHSIFLELKNRAPEPEERMRQPKHQLFGYRQEDLIGLRAIKQELRFLQKLREETYDKAVDDVLEEYQLNSIIDEELTFINKKANVFTKYLDGDVEDTDYFDRVQALQ